MPLQAAEKVVGCPVPSGVEQGREDLVLKIVVDQTDGLHPFARETTTQYVGLYGSR